METTKKYHTEVHVLYHDFHGTDMGPGEVSVLVRHDDMTSEYAGYVFAGHVPVIVVAGVDGSYNWDWLLMDPDTSSFSGFVTTQRELVGLLLLHLGEATEDDWAEFQDHLGADDETEAFEELTSAARSEGHGVLELVEAVEAILTQVEAERND